MPAETTIEIITRHREDLFALSRILFTAIDTPILTDAENPVTVSVRGTYGGGKKIIPDAAREALLGDKKQCLFDGKEEYDEIWRGTANGVPFEIAFINTDIKKGYDCIPGSENMREVAEQFMALRQSGGITFVHNNDGFGNHRAGIDIWMEKQGAPLVGIQGSLAKLSALSQTFNNVSNLTMCLTQTTRHPGRATSASAFATNGCCHPLNSTKRLQK